VAVFGLKEIKATDEVCDIIKAHKDFCGCHQSSSSPLNKCFLCPDGSQPTNLNAKTPSENSCSELDTYLRYLPEELCATERAEAIQRNDAYCGCPGEMADCYMCDDETDNLANPDRLVPFFEFLSLSSSRPCWELAELGVLTDLYAVNTTGEEVLTCKLVKRESRYCGCESETDIFPRSARAICVLMELLLPMARKLSQNLE
jgi:hypothetical protein